MPALDDIEVESSQEVSCGILTHAEYCALSDAVEHAEYIERVPELQADFITAAKHPLFARFRRAARARELAKAPEAVTINPSNALYSLVQAKRETGGLRRAAELEARLYKSYKDFFHTKQIEKKNAATEKRASNKAERKYWRERLASDMEHVL